MRSVLSVMVAVSAIAGCSADAAPNGPAGVGGSGVGGSASLTGGAGAGGAGVAGTAGLAGSAGASSGGSAGVSAGGAGGAGGASGGAGGAAAGSGGAGGAAGGGAGGGSGLMGSIPSMGCGTAATDTEEMFVQHDMTVDGDARSYFVRLPPGYDPMRAYPLMFVGPGCGGTGDNAIPVQDETGADAIVVGMNFSAEVSGRDCFMTESPESPELLYFDAMWAEVSEGYCVDTARVFYGGFSSGAWLSHLLGCARSNVLRAQGNVAGGPAPIPDCAGPIAAIMIHDENDGANQIDGGEAARERILTQNGCTGTETAPYDAAYPMCERYTGCPAEYPVVWCQTSGVGHDPQNDLSAPLFWKFLMELPTEPAAITPF